MAGALPPEPTGGPLTTLVAIPDASAVGEARRAATTLALQAGLDETARGALALLATESATNVARHAGEGSLAMRVVERTGAGGRPVPGVELLALDRGPGIADVARALSDGYSTGGTAGHGLGAMRRLAHDFDLYSLPGVGTAIVMRLWAEAGPAAAQRAPAPGAVCVPVRGEQVCGDGWAVVAGEGHTVVAVVDGLGHGPDAARAADAALGAVRAHAGTAPADLIRLAHGPLRATRGAALAVARIEHHSARVHFAGVGNIAASIAAADGSRSLASHNGTVGHEMRKVQDFTYDWPPGAVLLMHSDGVQTRWRLDAYPGLLTRDPALVAGVLFRDFARGRDDATVVVVPDARAGARRMG